MLVCWDVRITRSEGYLNICLLECLNVWILGYLDIEGDLYPGNSYSIPEELIPKVLNIET